MNEELKNQHIVGDRDLIGHIEESIVNHWNRDALTDYQGETLQYKDVARKIEKLHILFENAGVKEGDKIALCGRNSANWAVAFLATLTYGAVAVPILHEFKPEQVHDLVNHSDAKILFVGDHMAKYIDPQEMPHLEGIVCIADYSLLISRSELLTNARETLNALYGAKYPKFFRQQHVHYRRANPDEMALINYTSGTTSRSKGVIIPFRAIWSNYKFACQVMDHAINENSKVVSILPMAHMYGMAFEFIYEFIKGAHVYFLTRVPSPKVIFRAFGEIKPDIIISVPLIIEKVIKKMILPKLQTPSMKLLLSLPIINQRIRDRVKEQLQKAFGGNFYQIIIGGAAFNSEVEEFLAKIGFNYTVGYGATECAPIITYADWKEFKPGTCGKAAPRMEIKINSKDPQRIVGEILARGENVMLGYYKNEEATKEALDSEGWYHTGDLGVIDQNGNLSIRGRSKNMLLGANGQNIYPEEIEDKLNSLALVVESIVVQRDNKLIGLVYPDYDEMRNIGLSKEDLEKIMEENRNTLNEMIPAYCKLSAIQLTETEFEKTPKKSIKRFLYT